MNEMLLSWIPRYNDQYNVEVRKEIIEEINASGAEHSANEVKRNFLCSVCLIFKSNTEAVYRCYDGKHRSWTDLKPSRQNQVEKNKANSLMRAKQSQVRHITVFFMLIPIENSAAIQE